MPTSLVVTNDEGRNFDDFVFLSDDSDEEPDFDDLVPPSLFLNSAFGAFGDFALPRELEVFWASTVAPRLIELWLIVLSLIALSAVLKSSMSPIALVFMDIDNSAPVLPGTLIGENGRKCASSFKSLVRRFVRLFLALGCSDPAVWRLRFSPVVASCELAEVRRQAAIIVFMFSIGSWEDWRGVRSFRCEW